MGVSKATIVHYVSNISKVIPRLNIQNEQEIGGVLESRCQNVWCYKIVSFSSLPKEFEGF